MRYRNDEELQRNLEIAAYKTRDPEGTERIQLKVVKKFEDLPPPYLTQPETDHQAEDEQEHIEELKKREKGKDQQSELERLRVAERAVEMANHLTEDEFKEMVEEMVELRRKIAAGNMPQAQPSEKRRSFMQEDEFEDEEGWRRKEEDELERKTSDGPVITNYTRAGE